MQYVFRGRFSKGLNTITALRVTFEGREPSEVTDLAAMNWFDGHPDYERVAEEPAPERPVVRVYAGEKPDPLDHDGNGKKGGSKKRKAKKK